MALLENGIAKESQNERIFSTVFFTTKKDLGTHDSPKPNPWYAERTIDDPENVGHKKTIPNKVFVANTGDGYARVLGFRPRNAWSYGYLRESYEPGDSKNPPKGGDSLIFTPVLQHIAVRDGVPFGNTVMGIRDVDFFTWNVRKELKETVIPSNMPYDIQRTLQAFLYEGAHTVFRSGIGYFLTGMALVELEDKSRDIIPALYRFDALSSADWVRQELFPALEAMEGEGFLKPYVVVRQLGKGNPATFAGLEITDAQGKLVSPAVPKGMEEKIKEVYASLGDKETAWVASFASVSAARKQRVPVIYNGQPANIEVYNISKTAKYQIPVSLFEPRGASVGEVLALRVANGTQAVITGTRNSAAPAVVRQDPRRQVPAQGHVNMKDNAKPVEGDEWDEPVAYDPMGEYAAPDSGVDF